MMLKKVMTVFLSIMIAMFVFGCAKKASTQLDEGMTSKPAETKKADEARMAEEARMADEAKKADEAKMAEQARMAEEARTMDSSASGREDLFRDVHFDYDKFDILDADKGTLRDLSKWLVSNKAASVLVEGHCDERGTNEYNLALGDRRANSARDFLTASGVAASRIKTVSYGEEKPLCTEAVESCWSRNRRGHFVINGAK